MRCPATVQNCNSTAIIEVKTSGDVRITGKGSNGVGNGDDWVFASLTWIVV